MSKIFTTEDFNENMFNDCKIHAIAFDEQNFKILFDIDYIFKDIKTINNNYFISPATLIFENIYNLDITTKGIFDTRIYNLSRCNPRKPQNSKYINKDIEWD